jgi:dolichyl-diphosphooligosaccharide--protein glycosyltransferase
MFYLRAVQAGGDERISRTTSATPAGIIRAMSDVLKHRRKASANAIASGVCFGIVALGWKGFVYGPAIIFLAYFVQVVMNMFRRKDSTILSTLNLLMLGTIFVMVLPFYGHPQLDLVLNSTGLQPLLFIGGFTLAIAWITTGFRDKPWLLVFGSLFAGGIAFGGALYSLQILDVSNAWNVLTTGSGYFTKNKIFGTIAEASAPNRGQLFASFGPVVFILAIVMGIIALWDGIVKKNQSRLILGMWVIVAAYMAWSAGRFLFNAAPAMTVMGAWGIVTLWKASGAGNMARSWRRMGIRTPGERISNARKALWRTPQFSAIGMVLIMLIG